MTRAKAYSKAFGGKWTYDGIATWWCDDEKRHISRVAVGFEEDNNPPEYIMYGNGEPKRLWQIGFTLNDNPLKILPLAFYQK